MCCFNKHVIVGAGKEQTAVKVSVRCKTQLKIGQWRAKAHIENFSLWSRVSMKKQILQAEIASQEIVFQNEILID